MNKFVQLAVPLDVDARVRRFAALGGISTAAATAARIEIHASGFGQPAGQGFQQGSQHLKICVPALGVRLSRLVRQPRPLENLSSVGITLPRIRPLRHKKSITAAASWALESARLTEVKSVEMRRKCKRRW